MKLDIINKIQAWRYGQTGITGLNVAQNNLKMVFVLLTPFLAVWLTIQYFIVQGQIPEVLGSWMLLGTIFGWLAYCVGYWAYVTTDASKYKCLPQSTCFFPDGFDRKYTFTIKQDGVKERCRFPDGSIGVELHLLHRYSYQALDMPFPYIFKSLLLRIPSDIGKTFKFMSKGEFWHKGMIVTTNNCEHISCYFFRWVNENGEWKPTGIISDCSHNYAKALKTFDTTPLDSEMMHEGDLNWMLYQGALQRQEQLEIYSESLVDALENIRKMGGKKVKELVESNMSEIRDLVSDIQDTGEPWRNKLFNFKNWIKVLLIAGGIIAVLWFLGVITF